MQDRSYIVSVPVRLFLEVVTQDKKSARVQGFLAYEWICKAVDSQIEAENVGDSSLDNSPDSFRGYRIEANFDEAIEVRGTLDFDQTTGADEAEEAGCGDG